jgi:hypothetical protein
MERMSRWTWVGATGHAFKPGFVGSLPRYVSPLESRISVTLKLHPSIAPNLPQDSKLAPLKLRLLEREVLNQELGLVSLETCIDANWHYHFRRPFDAGDVKKTPATWRFL